MTRYIKTLVLSLFILLVSGTYSQTNNATDSLLTLIKVSTEDTLKAANLIELARITKDNQQKIKLLHEALSFSKKADHHPLLCSSYLSLYHYHERAGRRDSAFIYLKNLYIYAKKNDFDVYLGVYYTELPYINLVYFKTQKNDIAYLDSAISIYRNAYERTKHYSLQFKNAIGRKIETILERLNKDSIKLTENDPRLSDIRKLLSEIMSIKDDTERSSTNPGFNLSYLLVPFYQLIDKNDSAIYYAQKGLTFSTHPRFVAYGYTMLAAAYLHNNDFSNAIESARTGVKIATENGLIKEKADNLYLLYTIYLKMNDHKNALAAYIKHTGFIDSINTSATQNAQSMFDNQIKAEKLAREADLQKAKSKQQQTVIVTGIIGLVLVIIFSVFMVSRWRASQRQKAIIEKQKVLVDQKNAEIISSIRYAKRIQSSLLPTEKYIERVMSESKKKS